METAVRTLMSGFESIGDECRLFLLGGSFDSGWLRDIPHVIIGTREDPRLVRFVKYAVQPARELLRWRPDAVIAADVTTIQMARLARALTGNWKMPIASWIHFTLSALRMKENIGVADCHLAISSAIAEDIKAQLPKASNRVFTVFNGIETGRRAFLPRATTPTFLYVGRITYDDTKRVNDMLHALARLRGTFKVKIIGEPPKSRPTDKARLQALSAELGLADKVEWLGWRSDPFTAAGEASALVMTSAQEAFGMVLLEAIDCGLPCLSTNCRSGAPDIIQPGKNGWLFPVGDVARLSDHMQRIMDEPGYLPSPRTVQDTVHKFSAKAVAERVREALLQVQREMSS